MNEQPPPASAPNHARHQWATRSAGASADPASAAHGNRGGNRGGKARQPRRRRRRRLQRPQRRKVIVRQTGWALAADTASGRPSCGTRPAPAQTTTPDPATSLQPFPSPLPESVRATSHPPPAGRLAPTPLACWRSLLDQLVLLDALNVALYICLHQMVGLVWGVEASEL